MTLQEIENKIKEYKELQRMAEELNAEMDKIKDELKAEFEKEHTDTITTNCYKVTYKTVTTKRVDTTALKKNMPDVAERFTKATTAKRFTIN